MRLLAITTSWPHAADPAAGRFVRDLHADLTSIGHEVMTLIPARRREDCAHNGASGVVWPVHAANRDVAELMGPGGMEVNARRLGAVRSWKALRSFAAAVEALLRDRLRDVDGVLAHWSWPCGAIAVPQCRRVGRPLVVVAHGADVRLLGRPWFGLLPRWQLRRGISGVIATSAPAAERLLQVTGLPPSRCLKTPMGYDGAFFSEAPTEHAARADGPIVSVGRLVPIKGHAVLIEACRTLRRPLVIAGEGPERASLEALAGKLGVDLSLPGQLGAPSLASLMRSAAIVVFPSETVPGGSEGTPVSALEALACGAPVLASDVGGFTELLPPEARCAPGDPAAFLAKLERHFDGSAPVPRVPVGQFERRLVAERIADFLATVGMLGKGRA